MLDNRSYILLFCGLLGVLCFVILRPDIDFYANGPINESRSEIEAFGSELAQDLGFSMDSLAVLTVREQHTGYVKEVRDTLGPSMKPATLNGRDAHIQSWLSIIGEPGQSQGFISSYNDLFTNAGRLKIRYSNSGKVIRMNAHQDHPNPTFVPGDSVLAVAHTIVDSVLGYDLNNYQRLDTFGEDTLLSVNEINGANGSLQDGQSYLEFRWKRKPGTGLGESNLYLSLEPVVREFSDESGFTTQFGWRINSFSAKNEFEPSTLSGFSEGHEDSLWFNYLFFATLLILIILVFSVGIRNIFKGKAEWKRALLIFTLLALGIYGWRVIYFMQTYDPFLNTMGIFGSNLNTLLMALAVGLYGSLAYISWEALARSQKQQQLSVIDGLWQGKFFVSETGAALVHGFAAGGMAIGIFSVLAYLTGEYIFQADSQFGFAEASIEPRLLTINMSAWTTTWLLVIAQFGFIYSLLNHWLKKKWLAAMIAIVLAGLFSTVLGRLVGTSGSVFEDFILYVGIAVIFIYTLQEFGLLSVSTGWWFFSVFFMMQPYWGSESINVAYVPWVQTVIMAAPLVFGFIAYKFGPSIQEVGFYTPDYEQRMAKHLRVEREIEIARESQYKLMPLQPPKLDGLDVYGFFLPSFEVGGDYFDYVISKDNNGGEGALTMAVVDVSGKAMRAAMPAVFTSGLLLSRMKNDMPADILREVSEPIFSRTDKRTFITCVLARYDLESMKMSVANAGHCQPILKRNGVAEYIRTPDPRYPLGIKKETDYQAQEFSMKKGDFFFLYSDGLPEAVNEKGERFGFEEVPRLIENIDTDALSAQEIAQEIKRTVQKFSNYQLADDTTIICLKV